MMSICVKQYLTFEAEFMEKLSNTEAKLKKSTAYRKGCNSSDHVHELPGQ